jgi:hypothetical protein
MAFLRTFGIAEDTNLVMAFVLLKRAKEVFWIVAGLIALVTIQKTSEATVAKDASCCEPSDRERRCSGQRMPR